MLVQNTHTGVHVHANSHVLFTRQTMLDAHSFPKEKVTKANQTHVSVCVCASVYAHSGQVMREQVHPYQSYRQCLSTTVSEPLVLLSRCPYPL